MKKLIQWVSIILVSPLIILHYLTSPISKDGFFLFAAQLLSLLPGKSGSYLRIAFHRFTLASCHPDIVIGFSTLFSQQDTEIKDGVYIGPQCNIGSCRIGKNTLVASGVHIMSGSGQHRFDNTDLPIQQQGGTYQKISIGEDCWIGNGALVMADIGDKSIIGAGSVVTKPIPPYSIAVGNPARVVKDRRNSGKED